MKMNTTHFGRKMQHVLLLAFASLPVAMMIVLSAAPDRWQRVWMFPAAYVLLGWGCMLMPGKRRLPAGLLGAAVLAAMQVWFLPPQGEMLLVLLPVMYIGLLLALLPVGGWAYNQELPVGWHVAGVGAHVLLQLLVNGSQSFGSGTYAVARTPLLVSFLCYAGLMLLALNRSSLDSAAQTRRTVPLLMQRQNRAITLALLAVSVLIAAIPAIGTWLDKLVDWFMQGIAWVAGLLTALLPQGQTAGGGAAPESSDMGLGEAAPPSELALLLEKVIGVVAAAVLVVALLFFLRMLCRKLVVLLQFLWGRMGQYAAAAGEDYQDEITSTRDEEDTERRSMFARLCRLLPEDETGLTPVQQVRRRYRRLKRRKAWSGASTARENLPEAAARLYEKARYSGEVLTEAEAESFRQETKKV